MRLKNYKIVQHATNIFQDSGSCILLHEYLISKKTWKTQVEIRRRARVLAWRKRMPVNRARWRVGVGEIAVKVG